MLTDDLTWFKVKNRRILLELIGVLNYLSSQLDKGSDLGVKINFLKSANLVILERIFLSPEGRQWIYFTYTEIKGKGNKERLIPMSDKLKNEIEMYQKFVAEQFVGVLTENLLLTDKGKKIYACC